MMEALRNSLRAKIENENLSLRQVYEQCDVSFSTLSRFMRGGEITYKVFRKLEDWIENKHRPRSKPVFTRAFRVGKKKFLITVEES